MALRGRSRAIDEQKNCPRKDHDWKIPQFPSRTKCFPKPWALPRATLRIGRARPVSAQGFVILVDLFSSMSGPPQRTVLFQRRQELNLFPYSMFLLA